MADPIDPSAVSPLGDNQTPPLAPPEAAAPAAEEAPKPQFSDALLKMPAMQALFAGAPPALSVSMDNFKKRGEAKTLIEHKDELMQAGMGLYRSISGDTGVLFNQLHISGQQIQAADKAGKLKEIAPSFDEVTKEVSKSGKNNPVFAPRTPSAPPVPEVPQMNQMVAPEAAGAQRKLMAARVKQLAPTAPTAGAKPGSGALLNAILKPVL